jgi:hypothetical protein
MVQERKVTELKNRVARGEYVVDPVKVADAIVGRLHDRAARQSTCSYPDSSPDPSTNTRPGGPSTTRPTQFSNAAALVWRAFGGMQAQSS